jgi:hypothetical protein
VAALLRVEWRAIGCVLVLGSLLRATGQGGWDRCSPAMLCCVLTALSCPSGRGRGALSASGAILLGGLGAGLRGRMTAKGLIRGRDTVLGTHRRGFP